MANLPLTGSQYWGAALNNYLRQVQTDVQALKIRLDNFTVAASYSGSGWAESIYEISVDNSAQAYAEAVSGNTGVFKMSVENDKFDPKFLISGTLIFNTSSGQTLSINIPTTQNMKLAFGAGQDSDDTKIVHSLEWDSATQRYNFKERNNATIDSILTRDGYYPVYAIYDAASGFRVAVNKEQEFIFNNNYVLLGIVLRTTVDSKVVYFFGRKTDSAYKTIYETRKGNLEAFATVINAQDSGARGIFQTTLKDNKETGLTLKFGTSVIDYHSNGVSMVGDKAAEDDYDYKFPYDYKQFIAGRMCYMVETKTASDGTTTDTLKHFTTQDVPLTTNNPGTAGGVTFATNNIYGVYISCLGDILVEAANGVDTAKDLSEYTNSYIWDLNSDSNFRTGGLVFLGAFYHNENGWKYMTPVANSISPAFISAKSVENANIVKLPDTTYIGYENTDGKMSKITPYKYELVVPKEDTSYKNKYLLTLNTSYTVSNGSDGQRRYNIPVLPSGFYNTFISNNAFTGIRFGNVHIVNPTTLESDLITNPKIVVDSSDTLHCHTKFISSTSKHGGLADGIDNLLENVELAGRVKIQQGSGDNNVFDIARHLTGVLGLSTGSNFALKLNREAGKANLYLSGTESGSEAKDVVITVAPNDSSTITDLTLNTNKLTVNASSDVAVTTATAMALTSANNLTLTSSAGAIHLVSSTAIQVGNTLEFTSDERCKTNIQDISTDACVRLVKELPVKTFTYKDTLQDSIGVIAQELERLSPEFRHLLVGTHSTDELPDKKTVAETKLLFILWSAVQHLLNRGE